MCTLGLGTVNVHWCLNGNRFLTSFTFWIWIFKLQVYLFPGVTMGKSEEAAVLRLSNKPAEQTTDIQDKYNKRWTDIGENDPVPRDVPSIIQLKKILPKQCFQSDLKTSYYYVLKDLSLVTLLYISMRLVELQPYNVITLLYIPVYWLLQGTLFWALFVLGHDCGHGSFSNYDVINDITGTLLNTLIFVPFYPWKLTHKHHHKNTGNIDKDEIFYPIRAKHDDGKNFLPWFCFGGGWWAYLMRGFHPRRVNHFNPMHPLFVEHWFGCTCSVVSLALWSLVLCKYVSTYGLIALIVHYAVPGMYFSLP